MRQRGTGSITSYKSIHEGTLWRVVVRIDGREKSRAGFPTEAAATKAAPDLIPAWRAEATAVQEKASAAPTWSEALAQTIAERGPRGAWRDRTVETYTGLGKPITKALGADTSLDDLSRGDIRKLYATMIQSRSRGTVGLMASLVRGVFLTMLLDEQISIDIAASVPVPASSKPKRKAMVWSAEQAREFLAATSDSRWSALWRLWLASGARRGELLALQWRNVDAEAGTIRLEQTLHRVSYLGVPSVGETKTVSGNRLVVIDPKTMDALATWRGRQAVELGRITDWCFTATGRATPINPQTLSAFFRQECKRLELPPMRTHDLRHTAASLLIAEGVPVPVVAQRLGHSSPAVTMSTYAHAMPGQGEAAAGILGGLLDEGHADTGGEL